MNPFLTIALFGLALKIWAGYSLHRHWRFGADRIWLLLFLIASYLQTAVEIFGYLYLSGGASQALTPLMHTYYLLVIATIIIFPFSVTTVIHKSVPTVLTVAAIVLYASSAYILLYTDLIVQGYKPYRYMATRIPGDYYWVFQSFYILSILICPTLLVRSYRNSKNEIICIKSANLLIGFIPFGVGLTAIIVAMRMGSSITAAGILPLLISLYIVVLAENLREDRLVDLRAYLPWTRKARLLRRLTRPLRDTGADRDAIRALAEEYRRELDDQNRAIGRAASTHATSPESDTLAPGAVRVASRH